MLKSILFGLIMVCCLLAGCVTTDNTEESAVEHDTEPSQTERALTEEITDNPLAEAPPYASELEPVSLINPSGVSLRERFLPPAGFARSESEKGSFEEFLQTLPLKPDGSKVKYFDGREKTRGVYLAVVDYTLGDRDLQQCADAVMRLRAEYLYATERKDDISFNFVNGFTADFSKWASGYGISVDGNNVSWVKNNNNNASYESFQKYLDIVYAYSSTLSLDKELEPKSVDDIAIGDVFIAPGSPGHCVIVVDMAENEITGDKVFMLAQSYMPAQDIQILKGDEEGSPWFTSGEGDKLITPEWTFDKAQLKAWR